VTQAPLPPEVYARVFENMPEGVQILEDLVRRFHRPAKLEGGIDAIIQTYHREGQRAVVDFIINRCNQANGVPTDEVES
jgi:hypothetical protein